ncbi:unnamed protein product, partial [marine sediment metagenome]
MAKSAWLEKVGQELVYVCNTDRNCTIAHPSFYLEWMKTTLIAELNGELRVDARVQMIHPGITFYDEHTMHS